MKILHLKLKILPLKKMEMFGARQVHPLYGLPACDVPIMHVDDPMWSHSDYCNNNEYLRTGNMYT